MSTPRQQAHQRRTLVLDPDVHGVGGDHLGALHLRQHAALQLGRDVSQKDIVGAALVGQQLGSEIRKHVERKSQRVALVHVLVIAPMPAQRQALALLQPAHVDIALREQAHILGAKVGPHRADDTHR